MFKLGTNYGGWIIPTDNSLNESSIIYSGGVGEDISFDIKLQSKYNCNIFLIDPTKKSIKHFDECKKYFSDKNYKFAGNIQTDYYNEIKDETPNMNKFHYIDKGLWNEKTTLKFYKQENEAFVSQSLVNGMFSEKYDTVDVDSIKNIMNKFNHNRIDLLKLDIEGAEIVVLHDMLVNEIYPKYLCIEFDLLLKKKDKNNETKKLIELLCNKGYKIIINDNYNITFEYAK